MAFQYLSLPKKRLAYQRLVGAKTAPNLVFLGGFASDMTGTKASYLAERCEKAGYGFLRFDYSGHGASDGDFKDGNIGGWFEDACAVFDQLTEGPQIIIGSSMGGWLALMLAVKRPERVKALVGIAAAPDFTEDLMWLRMTPEQRGAMERDGFILDPTAPEGYQAPITLKLIQEARQHLMLSKIIPLQCPVRLIQGLDDREVPWQHCLRIIENIEHENVQAVLVKDGDHRLSSPENLELLWRMVGEFTGAPNNI